MPAILWALGSAIVAELAIFGGKKVYKAYSQDDLKPVYEEVEGDFWTEKEIKQGYRDTPVQDLIFESVILIGISWLLKKVFK